MTGKATTRLRKRILIAFSLVLFLSFSFTGIIFNVVIRLYFASDFAADRYYISEQTAPENFGGILIILVAFMFVVSVVASYYLSNSITRPIEKLDKWAVGIGKGNFDTNNFEFQDIELEDLNNALNKSIKQLGAYDAAQKDFFQNASHELRTPLTSIKVYAEGIVYGLMEPKKAGETILAEADRLSALVTDLLYIAKVDNINTTYTTEKADLTDIVRESAARQNAVAKKRKIKFTYDFDAGGVEYECVADLILRAVDNLISNAIRYAASEIVLSCHKKNDKLQICVADDGLGIEPEVLPHVFERFYKGDDGNTGIGLSIVKSIAEQHRGSVSAENKTGGGALFTITLPL